MGSKKYQKIVSVLCVCLVVVMLVTTIVTPFI